MRGRLWRFYGIYKGGRGNMKKLFHLIIILSLSIYCGPKQEEVERIMEDGVEVIVNHLEPYKIKGEPNTLHLTEEFIIDTDKDDIAATGLTHVQNFDVDSEGSLYFLNRRSGKDFVFKFDQNGNFITSFGRKGQGPGELMSPFDLIVDYRDDIVITDIVGKIVIFGKDGAYKKQVKTEQITAQALPLENGNYLILKRIFNPYGNNVEWPLLLCGPDLEVIKELGRYKAPNYRDKWGFPPDNFSYGVSEGKIFMGNSENDYEMRVFDLAGNLTRNIRKEFQSVEVSEELKKEIMERIEGSFMADGIFFHKHCPAFQYFFTDDEGHVFVMTYEEGENPREYMFDVFNSSGIFVSRILLGNMRSPFSPAGISRKIATAKNRHLYCLKEKENGHLEFVVYRMMWE
jgi:hypothetical protein